MELAAAVPMIRRFDALAGFYAGGRKLTAKGNPTLADARELVALLGLEDELEWSYGDRAVRTRSAAELPELTFTLQWALKAGVVRKQHGRLLATSTWAKMDGVKRFDRGAHALLDQGPLCLLHSGAWPPVLAVADVIDRTVPSLLAALSYGPADHAEALSQLCTHLDGTYRWGDILEEPEYRHQYFDHRLDEIGQVLEIAGLIRRQRRVGEDPPGRSRHEREPFRGQMSLTDLGRWWLGQQHDGPEGPRAFSPQFEPSGRAFDLRVALREVRPPVWRTFMVPSHTSLAQLHEMLQVVIGWQDYHLHDFRVGDVRYGIDDGEDWGPPTVDDRLVRLDSVVGAGDEFSYTYDFGDNWEHTIEVRAELSAAEAGPLPRCTGGEGRCPPEDVGGPYGYADFLAAVSDRSHPDHESWATWAGGAFDPTHFDPAEVNAQLAVLRQGSLGGTSEP